MRNNEDVARANLQAGKELIDILIIQAIALFVVNLIVQLLKFAANIFAILFVNSVSLLSAIKQTLTNVNICGGMPCPDGEDIELSEK